MEKMKIITMYLPQFHRVKENDEWWGDGFTEWTAVKAAEKYFEGQVQPRVPLNGKYYNLLEKETMEWQSQLMHEYNIYGMAFYHYWFKDGKKILEKPAENLLKWKDINMPFCFSWANETWARSWSNLTDKNAWSTKIDSCIDPNSDNGILLEQQYGGEKEWKEHFDYLKVFFKDERYIKKDGKPLLIIYKPMSIPCLVQMVSFWRKLAKQEGFNDIYVIGVNGDKDRCLDAILRQEPQNSLRIIGEKRKVINSQKLWDIILREQQYDEERVYYCGFSGYDDTPRRGEGGSVTSVLTPQQFEDNMMKLIRKSELAGNEFTFINAWNEWGEGMYLEPDELHGYEMLRAVRTAIKRAEEKKEDICTPTVNDNLYGMIERERSYWKTFDLWMRVMEQEKSIGEYFDNHGYRNIAIYGLGMLGKHLVEQLAMTSVIINYGIDQRGEDEKQDFVVLKPDDELPYAQVIVVAVSYDFGKIYKILCSKTPIKIVSLNEILGELLE